MKCEDCGYKFDGPVCANCGLVIEDHPISYNIPNGDRNEKKDPEKSLYMQKWYSPDISYATIHSNKTTNPELKRAFKIENQGSSNLIYGTSYINANNEIRRICRNMGLSDNILLDAIYWLRVLFKIGYIQRSYKKYACYIALIILAARYLTRLPISFAEISEYSNEKPKKIQQAYREIRKELQISINPFYLEEIVSYHCNKLGLEEFEKKMCIDFAKKVVLKSGRIPYGYSAAIIRIITNRTRRELSRVLKVSEPTITSRMRELGVYEL